MDPRDEKAEQPLELEEVKRPNLDEKKDEDELYSPDDQADLYYSLETLLAKINLYITNPVAATLLTDLIKAIANQQTYFRLVQVPTSNNLELLAKQLVAITQSESKFYAAAVSEFTEQFHRVIVLVDPQNTPIIFNQSYSDKLNSAIDALVVKQLIKKPNGALCSADTIELRKILLENGRLTKKIAHSRQNLGDEDISVLIAKLQGVDKSPIDKKSLRSTLSVFFIDPDKITDKMVDVIFNENQARITKKLLTTITAFIPDTADREIIFHFIKELTDENSHLVLNEPIELREKDFESLSKAISEIRQQENFSYEQSVHRISAIFERIFSSENNKDYKITKLRLNNTLEKKNEIVEKNNKIGATLYGSIVLQRLTSKGGALYGDHVEVLRNILLGDGSPLVKKIQALCEAGQIEKIDELLARLHGSSKKDRPGIGKYLGSKAVLGEALKEFFPDPNKPTPDMVNKIFAENQIRRLIRKWPLKIQNVRNEYFDQLKEMDIEGASDFINRIKTQAKDNYKIKRRNLRSNITELSKILSLPYVDQQVISGKKNEVIDAANEYADILATFSSESALPGSVLQRHIIRWLKPQIMQTTVLIKKDDTVITVLQNQRIYDRLFLNTDTRDKNQASLEASRLIVSLFSSYVHIPTTYFPVMPADYYQKYNSVFKQFDGDPKPVIDYRELAEFNAGTQLLKMQVYNYLQQKLGINTVFIGDAAPGSVKATSGSVTSMSEDEKQQIKVLRDQVLAVLKIKWDEIETYLDLPLEQRPKEMEMSSLVLSLSYIFKYKLPALTETQADGTTLSRGILSQESLFKFLNCYPSFVAATVIKTPALLDDIFLGNDSSKQDEQLRLGKNYAFRTLKQINTYLAKSDKTQKQKEKIKPDNQKINFTIISPDAPWIIQVKMISGLLKYNAATLDQVEKDFVARSLLILSLRNYAKVLPDETDQLLADNKEMIDEYLFRLSEHILPFLTNDNVLQAWDKLLHHESIEKLSDDELTSLVSAINTAAEIEPVQAELNLPLNNNYAVIKLKEINAIWETKAEVGLDNTDKLFEMSKSDLGSGQLQFTVLKYLVEQETLTLDETDLVAKSVVITSLVSLLPSSHFSEEVLEFLDECDDYRYNYLQKLTDNMESEFQQLREKYTARLGMEDAEIKDSEEKLIEVESAIQYWNEYLDFIGYGIRPQHPINENIISVLTEVITKADDRDRSERLEIAKEQNKIIEDGKKADKEKQDRIEREAAEKQHRIEEEQNALQEAEKKLFNETEQRRVEQETIKSERCFANLHALTVLLTAMEQMTHQAQYSQADRERINAQFFPPKSTNVEIQQLVAKITANVTALHENQTEVLLPKYVTREVMRTDAPETTRRLRKPLEEPIAAAHNVTSTRLDRNQTAFNYIADKKNVKKKACYTECRTEANDLKISIQQLPAEIDRVQILENELCKAGIDKAQAAAMSAQYASVAATIDVRTFLRDQNQLTLLQKKDITKATVDAIEKSQMMDVIVPPGVTPQKMPSLAYLNLIDIICISFVRDLGAKQKMYIYPNNDVVMVQSFILMCRVKDIPFENTSNVKYEPTPEAILHVTQLMNEGKLEKTQVVSIEDELQALKNLPITNKEVKADVAKVVKQIEESMGQDLTAEKLGSLIDQVDKRFDAG
ncbi:MAG: hypothetical protein ABI597_05300 [Gammaproteobacteria bacterium]